jgi:hypothetical protein
MSYEDRELEAAVRAIIDRRPVPDRPLRTGRLRTRDLLLAASLAAVLVAATAVAGQLLSAYRSGLDALAQPQPIPSATLEALPLGVRHLGPEAMAVVMAQLVGGRVDRIDEKLLTWAEFTRVAGAQSTVELPADAAVWIVAVAGDIPEIKKANAQGVSARWGVYAVDANSNAIVAAWTGSQSAWPAYFDALPAHPASLASAPPAQPQRLSDGLGAVKLGMGADDILRTAGTPAERTVSHGLGTPEWRYANGLTVFFRGASSAPGAVWRLRGVPPFDGATGEGVRIGSTFMEVRHAYSRFSVNVTADGQIVVQDASHRTLDVGFDAGQRVISLDLQDQP